MATDANPPPPTTPPPPTQIRSLPIRKDDEVHIMRGQFKGREGKVTAVYRKKFVIHIERIQKDKTNGASARASRHPRLPRVD